MNESPRLQIDVVEGESSTLDAAELTAVAAGDGSVAMVDVLALIAPPPGVTHVTVVSGDDGYRASIPISDLEASGKLLIGDPGDPAGAFRLLVPEGHTLCWNVKNVAVLRVTRGAEPDDVPENPPH